MRAPALALAAAVLLAPAAAALLPPAEAGLALEEPDPGIWHPFRVVLTPGQPAAVEVGPFPGIPDGPQYSRCQIFAPAELTCRGNEVFWAYNGTNWVLDPGIGLESSSNTWVHLVQEVNQTPVFALSLRTNTTHWLVPWLAQEAIWLFEERQWGLPQADVVTNVRIDVSHLPAASEFTFGGWHAYLGPPS